jgi:hypothetical protein
MCPKWLVFGDSWNAVLSPISWSWGAGENAAVTGEKYRGPRRPLCLRNRFGQARGGCEGRARLP